MSDARNPAFNFLMPSEDPKVPRKESISRSSRRQRPPSAVRLVLRTSGIRGRSLQGLRQDSLQRIKMYRNPVFRITAVRGPEGPERRILKRECVKKYYLILKKTEPRFVGPTVSSLLCRYSGRFREE